ncbi:hypothetical protein C922_02540 [Plasmodium inui San Antonio 1]|uniref:Uncharacterized protein n=1 Tax=Plasmodium inui San Antonio 1 TaxID=1237626 RepID=W7ANN4_9APIC|nr:hypothetical protein C922_02540 [Plasmodium inui San Antonio 1]EUD66956.1 hypothetical protein C922_02540 [Plasmodium inui San Antonio 1]
MQDSKEESIRSEPNRGDGPTRTNNDRKKKRKEKEEKCTNKITNFFKIVKSGKVAKTLQTPNPSNCENNQHVDEHASDIHTIINIDSLGRNSQVKENIHQTCDQNVLLTHVDAPGEEGTSQMEYPPREESPFYASPRVENELSRRMDQINVNPSPQTCGISNVKSILWRDVSRVPTLSATLMRKEEGGDIKTDGEEKPRDEIPPDWKPPHGEPQDEGNKRERGLKRKKNDSGESDELDQSVQSDQSNQSDQWNQSNQSNQSDELDYSDDEHDANSSLDMSVTEEDGAGGVPGQDQSKRPRVDLSSRPPTEANDIENVHLEPNRRDDRDKNVRSSIPPEEGAKVVKARKISLVNFFGNDIQITVNVNKDSASEGGFSSADSDGTGSSLGCTRRSKLRRGAKSGARSGTGADNTLKRRTGEGKLKGETGGRTPKRGAGGDEADTLRKLNPSYKRNSISDVERYIKNNGAIYVKKRKRERYNPDSCDRGEGGQANDELSQNGHANNPVTPGNRNYVKENKRVLKSDNEFELERAKTKRVGIGRVSCAGVGACTSIGIDTDAQAHADAGEGRNNSSSRAGRKTCLNVGFVTGFCRKARKSCAVGVGGGDADGNDDDDHSQHDEDDPSGEPDFPPIVHPDGAWVKHATKAQKRNRKDGAIGNHFETNLYQMKNNVQEKLTSIKNSFRLNDNVSDILNEKKRIKILRVLNKYYFDREYNDYVGGQQGRGSPQKGARQKGGTSKCSTAHCSFAKGGAPRELLRDHSSKPFTFFIAGKFTLFSNFALTKKLKDAGYGITSNLRRSNALIIGHDLSEDFVKKMEKFNGRIFGEEAILHHLNVDIKKRIDLFSPINKNNAKRYKFLINQTNIDSAPTESIERRVLQFCRAIRRNLSESLEASHSGYKSLFLSNLTKRLSDFFLFLHLSKGKFHSDINSLLYRYSRKHHELMLRLRSDEKASNLVHPLRSDEKPSQSVPPLRNDEETSELVLFVRNLCDVFSACYVSDDLLRCGPVGEFISARENRSKEKPLDSQASTPPRGIPHPMMYPSQSSQSKEDNPEGERKDTDMEKKIRPPGGDHDGDGYGDVHEDDPADESSLEYISPEAYFEETDQSGEMFNEEKELNNDSATSFERSITHNMKKSEKLKIVTNLWRVFFRPNSLYEIAGHKNEVLNLYRILRKLFPETGVQTPSSNGRSTSPKRRGQGEDPSDMHQERTKIIFLVYPPNCGVKRLVELICYACDLCPIYESKVQKYKNINYFFKYTHGLKPISIYNANKLDKNALNELNDRNDISICMYEDKDYVMNSLSSFSFPLLDNINHVLIKFGVPSRDALFYRCFSVCSCVIKNLNKGLFRIFFETCRLKDFSYSIESVYSKMHLVASYVNYMQRGRDALCVSAQERGVKTADESVFNFPNDVLQEYILNHLMNRFFMSNYDEVELALSGKISGKLGSELGSELGNELGNELGDELTNQLDDEFGGAAKYLRSNGPTVCHTRDHTYRDNRTTRQTNANVMKRLNEDYYFFRGFDVEDIRSLVHDWYDKMHIQDEKLNFDLTIKRNSNLLQDRSDYLYMDDGAKRDRERILIKVLELFLYASILVKSDDININLISVDMAVYWRKYLFMSPSFRLAWRGRGGGTEGGRKSVTEDAIECGIESSIDSGIDSGIESGSRGDIRDGLEGGIGDGRRGNRGGGKNLAARQKGEECVAPLTRRSNNNFINETKVKDHLKGKMDKCNKIFCEKVKKYRSLMAHFGCPFNFSSAGIVYDFLQNSKVANLSPRRRGDAGR